ncbi:Pyrophosphate-energized membrane proton pump 3 [Hondaea fermentalgiana]|uniref:H(+)-exporting diphosphatase n=1 Tax=Hondaea fermentalgiana TaxID=2315210 RepID=A0A2R5GV56_9STRA|nr:Pyrophosphate-energized membrane proton pump 3 [Hondaea fermentalgiana]|eukprot:GBG34727.1 Pyrophosphate-energized membrane proton pump 3 [Hondaea fermentalgiana]
MLSGGGGKPAQGAAGAAGAGGSAVGDDVEVMMPPTGAAGSSGSNSNSLSSRGPSANNAAAAQFAPHMHLRRSGGSTRSRKSLQSILLNLDMVPRSGLLRSIVGVLGFALVFVALFQGMVMGSILIICLGAIVVVWSLIHWMMLQDEGPAEMRSIASAIREGSDSFFARVYGTIFKLAFPMAFLLFGVYAFRRPAKGQESLNQSLLAVLTGVSFLLGAACSACAGYVGLWTSVRANVRVSAAAMRSYHATIQLALRSGAVAALIVVLLVVLGISLLFIMLSSVYEGVDGEPGAIPFARLPVLLIGFGFGGSFVAIFSQLGGGIFTKAADVGADLVGKVEQGIPEDDPRNPAVIADLVGDNVGDCSARGADLFESISAEIISAMVLGGTLAMDCDMTATETRGFVLFPLLIHAFDLIVSTLGVLTISDQGDTMVTSARNLEDPIAILKRGYHVAMAFAVIGFFVATRWMLYTAAAPSAWFSFFLCGLVGMLSAYLQVLITQYYTDFEYRPVKSIAAASNAGHATNVIAGLAIGMESVMFPTLVMCASILASFWLGSTSGLVNSAGEPIGGLFGSAVATMGMLSSAVYILAMDIFGPIADNAGGIVEMSGQPESVRDVTDRLDSAGNTTKATTKGFAVGSAALASFLLFRAFMDEVEIYTGLEFKVVDIATPEVFCGGFLGAAMVFRFSAMAMSAVGSAAQTVVEEVRRQFRDRPGILDGTEKPQYGVCVDVVSKAALSKMIKPGLLTTLMPIGVGVGFRIVGGYMDRPLLGAQALGGFLMITTIVGIVMALFLNNGGGAWDNTKKLLELQHSKGSEAHKAAVTGDTVGDPCKDTAGPALHVLIKLVSTITLVLIPLFTG